MTFLECECDFDVDFDYREVYGSVVECALELFECPYEAEVSLIITDGEGIRLLNREHRDIDKETDVLSFPMVEFHTPADFSGLESQDDLFDPDTGELILGDIIICNSRVFAQAEEYGHSIKREFAFLVAHSMLHLLGFDHMEEADAQVMEEKQRLILDRLSIRRF